MADEQPQAERWEITDRHGNSTVCPNKDEADRTARQYASWYPGRAPFLVTPIPSRNATDDGAVVPDGFVLVPRIMHLDADTLQAASFIFGGEDGEFCDTVLSVGITTNDDGKETYGLFCYSADYPEEGTIPLFDFAGPAAATGVVPDDEGSLSPEQLAQWLDARYARHHEDEDRQAAAMLRKLAAAPAEQRKFVAPHPDTIRLNWLEHMARNGGLVLMNGVDSERERKAAVGLGLRPGLMDRTLREAIDQAAPEAWNVASLLNQELQAEAGT